MRRVYRINSEGFYVEDVWLADGEGLSPNLIDVVAPEGFYKLKFDGREWIEGLSQAEIDEILNQPKPKTETELLQERVTLSEDAIDFLIMDGGL